MPSETVDCQAKRCGFNMLYEISSRHEEIQCGFVRCACCDLQAMAARMRRTATGTAGRKWSLRRCLDSMRYSLSNSFDVFCMARGPHVTGSGEGYRMAFILLSEASSKQQNGMDGLWRAHPGVDCSRRSLWKICRIHMWPVKAIGCPSCVSPLASVSSHDMQVGS